MIPEVEFDFATGVKRFDSVQSLRIYLKQLLDGYLREFDKVKSLTGDLLREEDTEGEKSRSKGWFKAGNMFANKSDPTRAGLDIMLQVIREAKPKVAALEESLKTFDEVESIHVPEDAVILLYLREGIPERIIVGLGSEAPTNLEPGNKP